VEILNDNTNDPFENLRRIMLELQKIGKPIIEFQEKMAETFKPLIQFSDQIQKQLEPLRKMQDLLVQCFKQLQDNFVGAFIRLELRLISPDGVALPHLSLSCLMLILAGVIPTFLANS